MYFYIQENIRGQKKVFLPFIPTGRRKREQSQLVLTVPGPGYNWWQEDRHIARGDRQADRQTQREVMVSPGTVCRLLHGSHGLAPASQIAWIKR
jgi:hypothetical protein